MQRRRASVQNLFDKLRDSSARRPILGQLSDLLLRGDLSCEEEPEKSFRKGLRTAGCLRKERLALGDCLSTETDTLVYSISDECTKGSS